MIHMSKTGFTIRGKENIDKVDSAIQSLAFPYVGPKEESDDAYDYITRAFERYGFDLEYSMDEEVIDDLFLREDNLYPVCDFEELLKSICRYVEPGSFIELSDDGELFRYVFLFDTLEKWTHPHTFFATQEAI